MISKKLRNLTELAERMEALLPTSTRTYRCMYAALEHDIDISLEGIAQRMIEKYNIPYYDPDLPTHDATLEEHEDVDDKRTN